MKRIQYIFILLIIAAIGLTSCNKSTDLEDQVAQLEKQLSQLQNSMQSVQNNVSQQNKTTTVTIDLTAMNQQIAALRAEIETLKGSQTTNIDLSGIEQQLSDIYSKIAILEEHSGITTSPTQGIHENHAWVDLGTGVMWATCNIGAENPEDYGNYFAWGETEPQIGVNFNVQPNKFSIDGSISKFSKYTTLKMELEDEDDAAHVQWKGTWRMPTKEDFENLYQNCTSIWTIQNGYYGRQFTSELTGNSIFFPTAGFRFALYVDGTSSYGNYWSRTLSDSDVSDAYYLCVISYTAEMRNNNRCYGQSIRPVCTPLKK